MRTSWHYAGEIDLVSCPMNRFWRPIVETEPHYPELAIATSTLNPACSHSHEPLLRVPLTRQAATLAAIVIPPLGLVVAVILLWEWGVSWADLGLLVGFYLLSALGITVGFHRLFVHRSFETGPTVKLILAALGSMAVQGPLFQWVARHRRHHQHSDTPADPHSPNRFGGGFLGKLRGLWHAHIGWAFRSHTPDLARYVRDLRRSRVLRVASALFPVWMVLGLALPAALGGLLTGSWMES